MTTATSPKTYRFAIIDAPGYCDNRAHVYSRHNTLAAARKALSKHYVNIPGNGRSMSACIVERETSAATEYVYWSGLRDAGYEIYGIDD